MSKHGVRRLAPLRCILLFFFTFAPGCRQPLIKAMYSTQRFRARCTPLSEWRWPFSRKGGVGTPRDLLHVYRELDACVSMPMLSPLELSRSPRPGRSPALLPLPAMRVRMRVRMNEGMPTWMTCSSVCRGASVFLLFSILRALHARAPSQAGTHACTHACVPFLRSW